jgi:hypothetical protein
VVKRIIFVVLEMLFFLVVYMIGSVLPGIGKLPMWTSVINGGKSLFIWDGLVVMTVAFVLVVLVQVLRKTIRAYWTTPVLALVLSLLLLAAMKFPLARLTP